MIWHYQRRDTWVNIKNVNNETSIAINKICLSINYNKNVNCKKKLTLDSSQNEVTTTLHYVKLRHVTLQRGS